MKIMFASDIHGDYDCACAMLEKYREEGAEKLILLGDILYHGPRNDLPDGYAPKKVIELLNSVKDELACVRGNCDTEVDQMVLEFPILSDCMLVYEKGRCFFITHGHRYNTSEPPLLKKGDILIHGHTHVLTVTEFGNGNVYLNPGSVSLPKEGNPKSYMVYQNGLFEIKDFEGNIVKQFEI
ncbi:MAG: phosphodiesterase [Clostridia bacterium]|nr:phosphodiesterase [Clostridia bacterium]